MTETRVTPLNSGGRLPATASEVAATLQALIMGEADALVVETAEGPRVFTLRDASEPYRQLIERMSQAAVVLDEGVVLYCNSVLGSALGCDTVMGERFTELVVENDRDRFDLFLTEGAKKQTSCEATLRKADGGALPTRMAAAPFSFDGHACVALVVTPLDEISSWRAARTDLAESGRRFRVALGNSPVAVFEQDLDLRYTWIFNPRLGYRDQDVLGRTDAELMDPSCAPQLEAIKRGVIATGQSIRAEVQAAAPGGPLETFDLYVEPRRDAAGDITGVTCAATDITDRKRAEEALRASDARKEFLLALTDAFKTVETAEEIVALASERLGRRVGGDQVIFAEIDARQEFATIRREWNGGSMPSNIGVHRLADFGSVVPDLQAGKSVISGDVANDPRMASDQAQAVFGAAAVAAFMSVPALKNGRLIWVLSVHARQARSWSEDECALAEEVAERTWAWVERARAEQALREGEKRMSNAQAIAGIGTWWWELATGRTEFNATYYEVYGIPPQPHDFRDFLALVHPEDRHSVNAAMQATLSELRPYDAEYRLRRANDGAERWFMARGEAVFGADRRPLVVTGVVQDITARKRAEMALRESEAALWRVQRQLRHAADAARLTYVEFDLDTQRVEFAENYADVIGREPNVPDCGAHDAFESLLENVDAGDRPRLRQARDGFLAGRAPEPVQYRVKTADGAERWIESRWSADVVGDGRRPRVFVSELDVTTLVQGRAALAAAKAEAERANLAKSKFLAAASHDLRQPVQSLVLLLPLIERHINATPKAAQVLGLMSKALAGLNVLLTAVLDVSRLDAGGIEPSLETVPLRGVCERLAAEYAPKAAACGLEMRVRTLDLHVRSDPALLERALRNLIENALRYTPEGGVLLAMRRRAGRVRIDVIDTGLGVPTDKQSEIFQEFHQLHNPGRDLSKGLGLGLAIVARVSNLLDAPVELASTPGRGSRFSLSLPVVGRAAPSTTLAPPPAPDGHGGSVLVIEDNQILRLAIETILSEAGYDTVAAASGEEALDLVKGGHATVDAIVTDYRLGAGLNGVELAAAIERQLGRTVPKLLLTGETGNQQLDETDLSSFEFLYKPISAEKLQARLAGILARASS